MTDRKLFVVGVNHRTAALAVRERLAFPDAAIVPALGRIREQIPMVAEAALLSTCNRVEFVGLANDHAPQPGAIAAFVAAERGVASADFASSLYFFEGREAVRHLFRVGASLDSMIVGEPQILGQLKLAYAHAVAAGTAGPVLHRVFHRAFAAAKLVRRETLVGYGAVSVSSAAVALAGQIFDKLADKTVMLIGAGKIAELAARNLQRAGVRSLLITSRTFDHAVALARDLGGTAVPFAEFKAYLKLADVVIASLAVTEPVLQAEECEAIIRERRFRPMFLIDLGVPRNLDARINAIANAYLYDIDDLGSVTAHSINEREHEAHKAEAIIASETDSFMRWLDGLELAPAIREIRSSIERLRCDELERNQGWLATLGESERSRIEGLTRGLVNKLMHRVLVALREGNADAAQQLYAADVARRLLCAQDEGETEVLTFGPDEPIADADREDGDS